VLAVPPRGRPRKASRPDQNGLVELVVDTSHLPASYHETADTYRVVEVSLAGGVLVRIHGHVPPNSIGQVIASIRDNI
jgi:hypothetical protein